MGDEVDCCFHCKKLNLFVWSSNSCAVDVKMDRSVLEYKSSFKMLVLF